MARDESLLTCVGRGQSPTTLRLYRWITPTVSLGYFQRFAELESLGPPLDRLPVVRRTTGGGAILHDLELTYSFALPLGHVLLCAGPNVLYELAHDAVIECLKNYGVEASRGCESDGSGAGRGPFFCFARRHSLDVLVGNDKIAGSAQRRTQEGVLQHGSIILGSRFEQQPTAAIDADADRSIERLRGDFIEALERLTGQRFETGEWTEEELAEAEALLIKYTGSEWTRRR